MTVVKVGAVILMILSAGVVLYGLVMDRTGQNIAFTVAGLVVLGLTMAFVAGWFGIAAINGGRAGRGAVAILGSLAGGLFAIGSAMALAAAVVFALLTRVV